jgi:transcription initiation factor TFIIIB Brf1 subunit/transcription initiation factor TFIIB
VEAKQMLQEFENISHEILGNFRADRDQVEEVVHHLWEIVRTDQNAPRVYVEQLVSALTVKTEINANACKLLEAKAKMMSAGKVAFTQNIGVAPGGELDNLLDKPMDR